MPTVSLAEVYASLTAAVPSRTGSKTTTSISPINIDQQCQEIDELWIELGYCIDRWRTYPTEFIATRFTNAHYVGVINKVDSAKPPEPVWQYLLDTINNRLYGRLVVMRYRRHTQGRVYSWK